MRKKKTMFALPFQPTTPNNNDLVQYSFLFQSSRNQEAVESMVILKRLDTNLIVSKLKSQ